MTVKFFWRCEGETLDGAHDFSAGDTTATANATPSIAAGAAKVGSNGVRCDSIGDQYRFDPASIATPGAGSIGFWFRCSVQQSCPIVFIRGANANDFVSLDMNAAADQFVLNIRHNTAGLVSLTTAAVNFVVDQFYFVVGRWNQATNYRRIEVYDSSGTLIEAAEDTTTAYTAPADFNLSTGIRIGDSAGFLSSGTWDIDNVFIGDAADDLIAENKSITSWTEFGGGAPITDGPKLHSVRSNLRLN